MSQTLGQSLSVPTTAANISNNNSQNILSPQQNQMSGISVAISGGISGEISGQTQSQTSSQTSINSTNSLPQNAVKNPVVILDKNRLQELVQEVDPNEQLEEEVEDMLLTLADDFIESLVSTSAMFAKHRKSSTLDVKDVQLALEKNWKIWIPGFGSDDQHRHHKKSFATEAHKQRMALIKKTLKKF